jgi:hypothetical protein
VPCCAGISAETGRRRSCIAKLGTRNFNYWRFKKGLSYLSDSGVCCLVIRVGHEIAARRCAAKGIEGWSGVVVSFLESQDDWERRCALFHLTSTYPRMDRWMRVLWKKVSLIGWNVELRIVARLVRFFLGVSLLGSVVRHLCPKEGVATRLARYSQGYFQNYERRMKEVRKNRGASGEGLAPSPMWGSPLRWDVKKISRSLSQG